jgi:hypothetical protein
MYYIILTFDIGSEYAWSGSSNDPYTFGMSSHPNVDWDFAFRTIVDKKPRGLNSPFLNFLENHPNMFPILRHLMKL